MTRRMVYSYVNTQDYSSDRSHFIEPSLYSRPSSSRVSCVNPVKNRLSVSTNRPVFQGVIQCCLSSLAHKSGLRKIAVSQSPRDLGFSWAAPSANPVFSTSC